MSNYSLKTLNNRLPVLAVPISGTKTVTVLLMVRTGSKYESKKENGLSHFLEHLFFKGTERYPNSQALAAAFDQVGGEYNAFTSKEYTGFWVKVAAAKLEIALDLVSDMLLNSNFKADDIEREKGVIVEELNMYEDNPLFKIEDLFESCLYGDSPAGRDVGGTVANVKLFKRPDFVKYFSRQYGANSSTLVLAGRLPKNYLNLAKKYFLAFPKNNWRDKVKVKELQKKPQLLAKYKKTDQTTLSLGVRAFPSGHKDEFVLKVLAVILGGSMSSRLFSEIREQRGLAYSVRTSAEIYTDTGYLTTTSGIRLGKEAAAVKVILDNYRLLSTELVSESELRRTKDMYKGRLAISLESSDSLANWYGNQAVIKKPLTTPEEYLKKIEAVSALDLRRVARKIFKNENLNLALIGPGGKTKQLALQKILKF
ncbi:insulinase family protein [Candidatus Falkowbacteria bacterium]|nr:pitrilysin family protein [Patescibacteria group bacterium]MDD3435385.1 pitrilysin family protein [Patescibacteria group bacterium]NCU42890.1 insulinase family protein [Candidatus Falkowbacteria bacterium]